MKRKLIIFGKGDFAQLAYLKFLETSSYEVVTFTVNKEYLGDPQFCGLPIVDFDYLSDVYPPQDCCLFLAIGYGNAKKADIFELAKKRRDRWFEAKLKGYQTISYISPKANVCLKTTEIGENCFIFDDVTIEPFSKIGNNVTIWSGSSIAHHSTIGDHCFLAPRVAIAGRVTVGESCFFGVNSTVRDSIKIADNSIIGAGAVILHDTQPNRIYKSDSTPPF